MLQKASKAKAVVVDKGVFPSLPRLLKKNEDHEKSGIVILLEDGPHKPKKENRTTKYLDKFRDPNTNSVRHTFQKTIDLHTALWENDLRHYHPDRAPQEKKTDFLRKNSRK